KRHLAIIGPLFLVPVVAASAQRIPLSPENAPPKVTKAVEPIRTLFGHTRWITALAFSPDDKMLASAGDKTIRIWDVATGQQKKVLTGHAKWTKALTISADGRKLASSGEDNALILWHTTSWEQTARSSGLSHLHDLTFSEQ